MSETFKFVIVFVSLLSSYLIAAENAPKCPTVPQHYIELNCTAIRPTPDSCPTSYLCPEYDARKCTRSGHQIAISEQLPLEYHSPCTANCFCESFRKRSANSPNMNPSFRCAHVECAEFFNREPDCFYQHDLKSCCSVNKVCGNETIEKLPKCYFNNKEYKEGETIYPEKECYTCVCSKDFNNATVAGNKDCKPIDCGLELHYLPKLQARCAPVYFKNRDCCPIEWICANKNYAVEAPRTNSVDMTKKCMLGKDKVIHGGESIIDGCTKCTCEMPPMLTCIKTQNC